MSPRPRRPTASKTGHILFVITANLLCLAIITLAGVLAIGFLIASDGVVQDVVMSPDQRITALVIRDDCGATCSCQMRVDLQTDEQYLDEIYRSWTACDAEVTWLSPTELQVVDTDGGQQWLNVREVGIKP